MHVETKREVQRVMPSRWFQANTLNKPLCTITGSPPRLLVKGERALGAFILPPFQRPPVWTQAQQVRLIESLWSGLPIGAYAYNETNLDDECDGWLLDGQQRVGAILAYTAGDFPIHGWRYPDLPIADRRGFDMIPIACLQTGLTDSVACREVYDRLAYGGTAHA